MSGKKRYAVALISTEYRLLNLQIAGANVEIRHEKRRGIEVLSNNPNIWTIGCGSISQIVEPEPMVGSAKRNGVADGGISVRGNVTNSSISTGRGNVSVGGNVTDSNICTGNGGNFFGGGRNWINGQEVGGNSSAQTEAESDYLEIVVPESFGGSLDLKNSGCGRVDIDRWRGGDLIVVNEGAGGLTVGQLSDINRCDLSSFGIGSIEIDSVVSMYFDAKLYGTGGLEVERLHTDSLSIQLHGTGNVSIFDGEAKSGSVANYGTGDVTLRGAFGSIRPSNYGSGSVKIRNREKYIDTK